MTHGTSATITMVADAYAVSVLASWAQRMLYDHRNFGSAASLDTRSIPGCRPGAIATPSLFCASSLGVGRIALWGDSYTGMVVLVVGALIDDVAAIVAQIPADRNAVTGCAAQRHGHETLRNVFASGDIDGGPQHTTGPMPVVSSDQMNAPSLLQPILSLPLVHRVRWSLRQQLAKSGNTSNTTDAGALQCLPDRAVSEGADAHNGWP